MKAFEIARRGIGYAPEDRSVFPGLTVAQNVMLRAEARIVALAISERLCLTGRGRIVFEGTPADLKNNDAIRKEWLAAGIPVN